MRSMPRLVSLAVLLVLIVTLGSTFFRVVAPFLLPLFLAVMTAIVCQPVYHYYLKRTKNRRRWAAGLTTFSIIASLLIPLITGILFASLQLYVLAHNVTDTREWQRIFSQIGKNNVVATGIEGSDKVGEEPAEDNAAADSADGTAPEAESAKEGESASETGTALEPSVAATNSLDAGTTAAPDAAASTTTASPTSPAMPETSNANSAPSVADGESAATSAEAPSDDPALPAPPMPAPPVEIDFWFDKMVAFGNQFLPAGQQRTPDEVAADIRNNINKAVVDLGNRSLGSAGSTVGLLATTAGTIAKLILAFAMYTIALFFFLSDGTGILEGVEQLIPVHAEYKREIMREFAKVVRSVVISTFLAAIAQGIAVGLALWFFGFPHVLVLLVLATLGALIPMVGTPIVWLPCVVALAINGHVIQAVLLFIYGAGFVGFMDNVIRAYMLNTDTKLHPLLAFVSVIGGLQAMGLWGVFIGPIVASCLYALVKIFNHELMVLSRERMATAVADTLGQQSGQAPRRYSGTDSLTSEMLREIARSSDQPLFPSRPPQQPHRSFEPPREEKK